MLKLICIGLLSGFFFSSTFILNRIMGLEGGHWVWTASLRYGYMILFLIFWFLFFKGSKALVNIVQEFLKHWKFWTLTGSIGFGLFYALICYSVYYCPGWIIATTWQTTIIATLFVLMMFGKRFKKRIWFFSSLVFSGVILVNISHLDVVDFQSLLLGGVPVLISAFCYPIGNQLVWEASNGNERLPDINSPIMENPFSKVLLMSLGTLPFWIVLIIATLPPLPTKGQLINTALVALFSGIIATTLFLLARNLSRNANELAAVDATQSSEVVFALLGEVMIIGAAFPGTLGIIGMLVTGLGLLLFVIYQD